MNSKTALRADVTPVPDALDPTLVASALNKISRTDFYTFIQRCFYISAPAAKFLPNWHIQALAHALEQVRLGKIKRLIINVPPRSLKSIAASVAFPAWLLGHDPTKRIITVSYG